MINMQPSGTLVHPQAQIQLKKESSSAPRTGTWQIPTTLKPGENRIVVANDLADPNFNTLLPSLIKTSEDEKVYAALQFK